MLSAVDNWIHGESRPPRGGRYITGLNPANGLPTAKLAQSEVADLTDAVDSAHGVKKMWKDASSDTRMRVMHALAAAIRAEREDFVRLEMEDTGKPERTARAEIDTAADYFEFYAGLINLPLGDVLDVDPNLHVFTTQEPYGVIGVITPWNVPLNQAARAVAPALATGNVVVVKPAESTPRTTVKLARLASQVGLPAGAFNVVLGSGPEVGSALVGDSRIRKVAFTGSVQTGRAIGAIAAERIIPLTLELGGKSANIVFADADFDRAAEAAVRAFLSNAGQICSSGTRLLVQESVHDEFVGKVAEIATRIKTGTDLGPMITRTQYDHVHNFFEIARAQGHVASIGGHRIPEDNGNAGFFVEPTIYPRVSNESPLARQEIFGPVLVTIPFTDEEDALRIANDSDFGLVAGVFTQDVSRGLRMAKNLDVGQVFVNDWGMGGVKAPFGGTKHSGYGREKGIEAMRHYTHTKSILLSIT